jgi:putative ABC transport system substrate-binding protein
MKRRAFLVSLMGMTLGSSIAQGDEPPGKVPRVGILSLAKNAEDPRWKAFRRGLRELGYIEGQNIALEYRFARGDFTLLRPLTEELANLPVEVIMGDGVASGQAAAAVIRTTPIVIGALGADPIALGLATGLARPGRNVTGFTITAPELAVKRVDLVRAAFPVLTTITVLMNPSKAGAEALFRVFGSRHQRLSSRFRYPAGVFTRSSRSPARLWDRFNAHRSRRPQARDRAGSIGFRGKWQRIFLQSPGSGGKSARQPD